MISLVTHDGGKSSKFHIARVEGVTGTILETSQESVASESNQQMAKYVCSWLLLQRFARGANAILLGNTKVDKTCPCGSRQNSTPTNGKQKNR